MAFSDELNKTKEGTTATETKATGTGTVKAGSTKADAFKQKGASLRAQLSDDQKAIEGSKSDKVAFVCALGDPSRKQKRKEGNESLPSYVVVGYKFKALEDMEIPTAPIKKDWKTPADVDLDAVTWTPVKAGTVFALNSGETGILISKEEYAGSFSGEGQEVSVTAKFSKDRELPMPVLRISSGKGSIKANLEEIAEMVGATDTFKGSPKLKDEFAEKFAPLYVKKSAGKKSASGKGAQSGEATKNVAAAFRALYASK